MRQDLEKQAKELNIAFTAETTDEALALMIELAQSNAVNAELAEKVAKLETANATGGNLTVIKHGKVLYTTHAKQFFFKPSKRNPVKRANGTMNRGLQSLGNARIVKMDEIELPENEDALEWLVENNSPLLKVVEKQSKGKK